MAKTSKQPIPGGWSEFPLAQAVDRIQLVVDAARRGQPLHWSLKLAHIHAYLDKWLPQALDRAVAEARAEGASWGDIGSRVGMSRQAAHKRWGP